MRCTGNGKRTNVGLGVGKNQLSGDFGLPVSAVGVGGGFAPRSSLLRALGRGRRERERVSESRSLSLSLGAWWRAGAAAGLRLRSPLCGKMHEAGGWRLELNRERTR